LHAFTAIKTLPFHNVKALLPKSSHHEDVGDALTFGWFGGAFLSITSVQKLAIWADPILTSYKVGIIGS
jgi:hypothetical protein